MMVKLLAPLKVRLNTYEIKKEPWYQQSNDVPTSKKDTGQKILS